MKTAIEKAADKLVAIGELLDAGSGHETEVEAAEPAMKQTTVRLPADLHRAAKAQAAKEDVSLEAWIAGAMREGLRLSWRPLAEAVVRNGDLLRLPDGPAKKIVSAWRDEKNVQIIQMKASLPYPRTVLESEGWLYRRAR